MKDAIKKIFERVYSKSETLSKQINNKPLDEKNENKILDRQERILKKEKILNDSKEFKNKIIIFLVYILLILFFIFLCLLLF